jgi:hypothetical protein
MLKQKYELEEVEDTVIAELTNAIMDIVENGNPSVVKDMQPPSSVVKDMATAAAQVLIAFEHGYRMGG